MLDGWYKITKKDKENEMFEKKTKWRLHPRPEPKWLIPSDVEGSDIGAPRPAERLRF